MCGFDGGFAGTCRVYALEVEYPPKSIRVIGDFKLQTFRCGVDDRYQNKDRCRFKRLIGIMRTNQERVSSITV